MQLTVLGKYGPYPAANGGTSAYLVRADAGALALDFGSGALGRLTAYLPPEDLTAIVLSHLHFDHMCDLLPLSYRLQAQGRTLDLILPDSDCAQRALIESCGCFRMLSVRSAVRAGQYELRFEKMEHPLESYAVKVTYGGKTLCYGGDTSYCPQLPAFAAGSDLLLLDCGKKEGTNAPHLSLREAEDIANELQIPAIATHLNPALSYRPSSPLVTVAEEGKVYRI